MRQFCMSLMLVLTTITSVMGASIHWDNSKVNGPVSLTSSSATGSGRGEGRFHSLNALPIGKDGTFTFSFNEKSNMICGLTNKNSSATNNWNVDYYIKWYPHPHSDQLHFGINGETTSHNISKEPVTNAQKEFTYNAIVSRAGNVITLSVTTPDGVKSFSRTVTGVKGTQYDVSDMELIVDGATWGDGVEIFNMSPSFQKPLEVDYSVRQDLKSITVSPRDGEGGFSYEWTKDGIAIGGSTSQTNCTEGTYKVKVTSGQYVEERTFYMLGDVKPMTYSDFGALNGGGSISGSYNADIDNVGAANGSFGLENRMNVNEDGAMTVTWDSWDRGGQMIGLTNYESSAQYNWNVHYYVQYVNHPYGDAINYNIGNGTESIPINRYPSTGNPKENRYTARLERVGDEIKVKITSNGQDNWEVTDGHVIAGVSQKHLYVDAYIGNETWGFHDLNVNFGTPIDIEDEIDLTTKTVNVTATGGSGNYNYTWFDANDNIVGSTANVTFAQAGTYRVLVEDASVGWDNSVYKKERMFEIIDNVKPMAYYGEGAILSGSISSAFNGTINRVSTNGTASFGLSNHMSIGENGSMVYTWDARKHRGNSRLGFTNRLSSSSVNANAHYYIEWYGGNRDNTIRVNVGEGVINWTDAAFTDGHASIDAHYTAKIERIGNQIKATLHCDAPQTNWTKEWIGTPSENVSAKRLYPDVMIGAPGDENAYHNVNVNFATPIYIDDVIEQEHKRVTLNLTGGSGEFDVVWKDANDATVGTGLTNTFAQGGTYKAVITDRNYDASIYIKERTYFILDNVMPVAYYDEGAIQSGTLSGEYNTRIENATTKSASFGLTNHMNANEDGAMVFRFDARENSSLARIGFTNRLSSPSINANVQYYIELYKGNRDNIIRVNVGEGVVTWTDPGYVDGHADKDMFYTAKIERIGNQIKATLIADGQVNWKKEWIGTPSEDVSKKRLYPDVALGNANSYIDDVAVSFATPIYLDPAIDRENNTIALNATGGSGEYDVTWEGTGVTPSTDGLTASFTQSGTFKAIITDKNFDASIYKKERVFHMFGEAHPLSFQKISGGNLIQDGTYTADLSSDYKSTSIVSDNVLKAGNDGAFTFNVNSREGHITRVGFTDENDSYNLQYTYMGWWVEFNRANDHVKFRYNIGNGTVETERFYRYGDGGIHKDVDFTVKMERRGGDLILTVDADGQHEMHLEEIVTPTDFASKNLLIDAFFQYAGYRMDDFSASFAQDKLPLEITEAYVGDSDCDNGNGSATFSITSGNGIVTATVIDAELNETVLTGEMDGEIIFTSLQAGDYTVNVIDEKEETFSTTFTIEELNTRLEGVYLNKTGDLFCSTPASFEVVTLDPTLTYDVSWSIQDNGEYLLVTDQMTGSIGRAGDFVYDIDIKVAGDEFSCYEEFVAPISVLDNSQFSITHTVVDESCNEEGAIEMSIDGPIGTDVLTYVAVLGTDADGQSVYRAQHYDVITPSLAVPAGNYHYVEIKATDNETGCVVNEVIETGITVGYDENLISATLESTDYICLGEFGTIKVADADFNPAYTYRWSVEGYQDAVPNHKITKSSTGSTVYSLKNGTYDYTLVITDPSGEFCETTLSNTIRVENGGDFDIVLDVTPATCDQDFGVFEPRVIGTVSENAYYYVSIRHEDGTRYNKRYFDPLSVKTGKYTTVNMYVEDNGCKKSVYASNYEFRKGEDPIYAELSTKKATCNLNNGKLFIEQPIDRVLTYSWTITNTEDQSVITSSDPEVSLGKGLYNVVCVLNDPNNVNVCEYVINETQEVLEELPYTYNKVHKAGWCDGNGDVSLDLLDVETGAVFNSGNMYYNYVAIPENGGYANRIQTNDGTPLSLPQGNYTYLELKVTDNVSGCSFTYKDEDGYVMNGSARYLTAYKGNYDQNCTNHTEGGAISVSVRESGVSYGREWNITNKETGERMNPDKLSWSVQHLDAGIYDLKIQLTPRGESTEDYCPKLYNWGEHTVRGPLEIEETIIPATCDAKGSIAISVPDNGYTVKGTITSQEFYVKTSEGNVTDVDGDGVIELDAGDYLGYYYNVANDQSCVVTKDVDVLTIEGENGLTYAVTSTDATCEQEGALTVVVTETQDVSYNWLISNTETGVEYTSTEASVNAPAGTYNVNCTILSNEGIYCETLVEGEYSIGGSQAIAGEFTFKDYGCVGDWGRIEFLPTLGTHARYTYNWTVTGHIDALPGTEITKTSNNNYLSTLKNGSYHYVVTITDKEVEFCDVVLEDDFRIENEHDFDLVVDVSPANCDSRAIVTPSVVGNLANIVEKRFAATHSDGVTTYVNDNFDPIEMKAGQYSRFSVYVLDQDACRKTIYMTGGSYGFFTIEEGDFETIEASIKFENEDCDQGNGMVYVENTDGRTLNYDWKIVNTADGSDMSANTHQVALSAGTFEVSCVVTDRADASVCELRLDETITIENVDPLKATVLTTPAHCDEPGTMELELGEPITDQMYFYYAAIPADGSAATFNNQRIPLEVTAGTYNVELRVTDNTTGCEFRYENTNHVVNATGRDVYGNFDGYGVNGCDPNDEGAVTFNKQADCRMVWTIINQETGLRHNEDVFNWRVQKLPAGKYDLNVEMYPRNGDEEIWCPVTKSTTWNITGPSKLEVVTEAATCEEEGAMKLQMVDNGYSRMGTIASGSFSSSGVNHNGNWSIPLAGGTYNGFAYNVTDDDGCSLTLNSNEEIIIEGPSGKVTADILAENKFCDNGFSTFSLENASHAIESYNWTVTNTVTGQVFTEALPKISMAEAGNYDVSVEVTTNDENVCENTLSGNFTTITEYPFSYERVVTNARCDDQGVLEMIVTDKVTGQPYAFNDHYKYFAAVPAAGYDPTLVKNKIEKLFIDAGDYSDPRSEAKVIEHLLDGRICEASIKGGFIVGDDSPAEQIEYDLESDLFLCNEEATISMTNVTVASYNYSIRKSDDLFWMDNQSYVVNEVGDVELTIEISDNSGYLCDLEETITHTVEEGRIERDLTFNAEQVDCRESIEFSFVNNGDSYAGDNARWEVENTDLNRSYDVVDKETHMPSLNTEITTWDAGAYVATLLMDEVDVVGQDGRTYQACALKEEISLNVSNTCEPFTVIEQKITPAENCIEAGSATFLIENANGTVHYWLRDHNNYDPKQNDWEHMEQYYFTGVYKTAEEGDILTFSNLAPGHYTLHMFDESSYENANNTQVLYVDIEQLYEDPMMNPNYEKDENLGCEGADITFDMVGIQNDNNNSYPSMEYSYEASWFDVAFDHEEGEYPGYVVSSDVMPLTVQNPGQYEVKLIAYDPVTGCTFTSQEGDYIMRFADGRMTLEDDGRDGEPVFRMNGSNEFTCDRTPELMFFEERFNPGHSQVHYKWTVTQEDGSVIEVDGMHPGFQDWNTGGEHHVHVEAYNEYDCSFTFETTVDIDDQRIFPEGELTINNKFCETSNAGAVITPTVSGDYAFDWNLTKFRTLDKVTGDQASVEVLDLARYYGKATMTDLGNPDHCPLVFDIDHTFIEEGNFEIAGFISTDNAECNLPGEGTVEITGALSNPTYAFNITKDGFTVADATTERFNLMDGDYSINATVTDGVTRCIRTVENSPLTIENVNPLKATVLAEDAHCSRNGYVYAEVEGNEDPSTLSYSWETMYESSGYFSWPVKRTGSNPTKSLTTWKFYEYANLTLVDNYNGCTVDASKEYFTASSSNNIRNSTPELATDDATCDSKGKVRMSDLPGLIGNYSATWTVDGNTRTIKNYPVDAGTYSGRLQVLDYHTRCRGNYTVNFTVDLDNDMDITITNDKNAICTTDGQILVQGVNIKRANRVGVSMDILDETATVIDNRTSANHKVAAPGGTYDVVFRVTDDNSACEYVGTHSINVTTDNPLTASMAKRRDENCNKAGLLRAVQSGGKSPFTYAWDINDGDGVNYVNDTRDFELVNHDYSGSVVITDANGCEATANVNVEIKNNCRARRRFIREYPCNGENGTLAFRYTGGTDEFYYELGARKYEYFNGWVTKPISSGVFEGGINANIPLTRDYFLNYYDGYRYQLNVYKVNNNGSKTKVETRYVVMTNTEIDRCRGNGRRVADPELDSEEETEPIVEAVDMDVIENEPTGLANIVEFTYYPNPATDRFNIQSSESLENATVEIFNAVGAMMTRVEVTDLNTQVDISNYVTGMYFVRVKVNGVVMDQQSFIVGK